MPARILVVEDNEKNRVLIRDLLAYRGYEVIEAGNGEEGIRKAAERPPDLILLDIQMPLMDGYAALKKFREMPETRHVKVIALTSFAMAGDRERILQAGFNDYISKPINTRQLPALIQCYLGG